LTKESELNTPSNPFSILIKKPETIAGLALIITGAAAFLDQYLNTGWLSIISLPLMGFFFVAMGVHTKSRVYIISGSILSGFGTGVFTAFFPLFHFEPLQRIGVFFFCFGAGWLLMTFLSTFLFPQLHWWPLVPGGVFCGLGSCFIFSSLRVVDFFFAILIGLSLALLLWGSRNRLLGLIIPGGILLGIGLGLFMAWGRGGESSSLARTGIMLVWFALGWGCITLLARILFNRFIWWPLIPGGVLFMVGLGLYLGGNPGNAVGFIRNTGSIGLVIFGLYLLLMRRGIRQ
jgi:hypothetical protein